VPDPALLPNPLLRRLEAAPFSEGFPDRNVAVVVKAALTVSAE
jgi:hypothetical protein